MWEGHLGLLRHTTAVKTSAKNQWKINQHLASGLLLAIASLTEKVVLEDQQTQEASIAAYSPTSSASIILWQQSASPKETMKMKKMTSCKSSRMAPRVLLNVGLLSMTLALLLLLVSRADAILIRGEASTKRQLKKPDGGGGGGKKGGGDDGGGGTGGCAGTGERCNNLECCEGVCVGNGGGARCEVPPTPSPPVDPCPNSPCKNTNCYAKSEAESCEANAGSSFLNADRLKCEGQCLYCENPSTGDKYCPSSNIGCSFTWLQC